MQRAVPQLMVEVPAPEAGRLRAVAVRIVPSPRGRQERLHEASPRGGKTCGIARFADLLAPVGSLEGWFLPAAEEGARAHTFPETPGRAEAMREAPALPAEGSAYHLLLGEDGAASADQVWVANPTDGPRSAAYASRFEAPAVLPRTAGGSGVLHPSRTGPVERPRPPLREGPTASEDSEGAIPLSKGPHLAGGRATGSTPAGVAFTGRDLTGKRAGYVARESVRIRHVEGPREGAGKRGPESADAERTTSREPFAGEFGKSVFASERLSSPDAPVRPGVAGGEGGRDLPREGEAEALPRAGAERENAVRGASRAASPASSGDGMPSVPSRERAIGAEPGNPVKNPHVWDRLMERVAGALRTVREGEVFRTRLRLHPPQLGSLEVEAEWSGMLRVSLQAQSPQAFDVIREGLEQLRQLLLTQGLPLQDLQLSLKGDGRRGEGGGELTPASPPAREAVTESAPETGTRGWPLGTLDLWV